MDKCTEEFEKWYEDNGNYVEIMDYKAWCNYAFDSGWQARQSEIDALKAQVLNSKNAGWKYYYKVDDCTAINSHDGNCICWHHEGTGKFPNARHDEENTLFEWKLFTTPQPAPDTVQREKYNKLLEGLYRIANNRRPESCFDAPDIAENLIAEAEGKEG